METKKSEDYKSPSVKVVNVRMSYPIVLSPGTGTGEGTEEEEFEG